MKLFISVATFVAMMFGLNQSAEARYFYTVSGKMGIKLVSPGKKTKKITRKIKYQVMFSDDHSFCEIQVKGEAPVPCTFTSLSKVYGEGCPDYSYKFTVNNSDGAEILRQLNLRRKNRAFDLINLIDRYETNGKTSFSLIYETSGCRCSGSMWHQQDIQIDDSESLDAIHLFSKAKRLRKL